MAGTRQSYERNSEMQTCYSPGCLLQFRRDFLAKHCALAHPGDSVKSEFYCDYQDCKHYEQPFHQQSGLRSHLFDVHFKGEIISSGGSAKGDPIHQLRTRRCHLCLELVTYQRSSWVCPNCNYPFDGDLYRQYESWVAFWGFRELEMKNDDNWYGDEVEPMTKSNILKDTGTLNSPDSTTSSQITRMIEKQITTVDGKPPFTDSGYGSAPNLNLSMHSQISGQDAKDNLENDIRTSYSGESGPSASRAQQYISEFCGNIYRHLDQHIDANSWSQVSTRVPELLKAFALKFSRMASTQQHHDITFFVHKHHKYAFEFIL